MFNRKEKNNSNKIISRWIGVNYLGYLYDPERATYGKVVMTGIEVTGLEKVKLGIADLSEITGKEERAAAVLTDIDSGQPLEWVSDDIVVEDGSNYYMRDTNKVFQELENAVMEKFIKNKLEILTSYDPYFEYKEFMKTKVAASPIPGEIAVYEASDKDFPKAAEKWSTGKML